MTHSTKSSVPATKEKSPSADVSLESISIFENAPRINAIKIARAPPKNNGSHNLNKFYLLTFFVCLSFQRNILYLSWSCLLSR